MVGRTIEVPVRKLLSMASPCGTTGTSEEPDSLPLTNQFTSVDQCLRTQLWLLVSPTAEYAKKSSDDPQNVPGILHGSEFARSGVFANGLLVSAPYLLVKSTSEL